MRDTLRFIRMELLPHARTLLSVGSLAVIAALVDLAGPILMAYGIDAALRGSGVATAVGAAGLWFLARMVASWLRSTVTRRGENMAQEVGVSIVERLYMRFISLPLSYHLGAEGQRMREDVGQLRWKVSNAIANSLFNVGAAVLTLVALLGYITWVDPSVAAVLCAALVCFGVYTGRSGERMVPEWEAWNKSWSALSRVAGDALTNILVVKSSQSEDALRERLLEKKREFMRLDVRVEGINHRITVVQDGIIAVATAVIMTMLLLRLESGAVTVGAITAVLAYSFNAFGQMRSVQYGYRALVQVHAAREIIEKELLPIVPEDLDAGEALEDVRGDVDFTRVSFRYRADRPILSDVSFSVRAGERIAIVGESGEGKSTVVDLLGRYYDRTGGAITVDGRDIRDVSLRSLRGAMAYVPQDLTLLNDTLLENVRIGRSDASDADVAEAIRLARLDAFVASLPEGGMTKVGERGLKLSGGERQRVALARAFLRKPRILILDEPTSNLDAKTELAVQASLRELMRGRTTFIIAHRLKTVQEMDRILVLKDGRIAESGTHAELAAADGPYKDLLKAQHLYITPDEPHLGDAVPDAAE